MNILDGPAKAAADEAIKAAGPLIATDEAQAEQHLDDVTIPKLAAAFTQALEQFASSHKITILIEPKGPTS